MIQQNYPILYRGSVKDVLGPIPTETKSGTKSAVVFHYTDSFSVFDWGRMPDSLEQKGQALAMIAAHWFEKLEAPETWREFSRTPEALALRKGSRFGAAFNELGERFQENGLRTHYLGVIDDAGNSIQLKDATAPVRHMAVREVSVVKPVLKTVLGRSLPDYFSTRNAPLPRLVPLEVVFRFGCPEGSSLIERVRRDHEYMTSIGFPDFAVTPGQKWDFPVIELFTKLEATDRPLGLSEALAITGLSAEQLQEILLSTAWVGGILKRLCAERGLELADGKLEWGLDEGGHSFLVDAVGPDELRLLRRTSSGDREVQLSKEFLRAFYRSTPWYTGVERAKRFAATAGSTEWKRMVNTPAPKLPENCRVVATQLYQALANELTGRPWFPKAWSLEKVTEQANLIIAAVPAEVEPPQVNPDAAE